jgi:hypothetical protein
LPLIPARWAAAVQPPRLLPAPCGPSPREPGMGERGPACLPRSPRSLARGLPRLLPQAAPGRCPRTPERSSATHCRQQPCMNEPAHGERGIPNRASGRADFGASPASARPAPSARLARYGAHSAQAWASWRCAITADMVGNLAAFMNRLCYAMTGHYVARWLRQPTPGCQLVRRLMHSRCTAGGT